MSNTTSSVSEVPTSGGQEPTVDTTLSTVGSNYSTGHPSSLWTNTNDVGALNVSDDSHNINGHLPETAPLVTAENILTIDRYSASSVETTFDTAESSQSPSGDSDVSTAVTSVSTLCVAREISSPSCTPNRDPLSCTTVHASSAIETENIEACHVPETGSTFLPKGNSVILSTQYSGETVTPLSIHCEESESSEDLEVTESSARSRTLPMEQQTVISETSLHHPSTSLDYDFRSQQISLEEHIRNVSVKPSVALTSVICMPSSLGSSVFNTTGVQRLPPVSTIIHPHLASIAKKGLDAAVMIRLEDRMSPDQAVAVSSPEMDPIDTVSSSIMSIATDTAPASELNIESPPPLMQSSLSDMSDFTPSNCTDTVSTIVHSEPVGVISSAHSMHVQQILPLNVSVPRTSAHNLQSVDSVMTSSTNTEPANLSASVSSAADDISLHSPSTMEELAARSVVHIIGSNVNGPDMSVTNSPNNDSSIGTIIPHISPDRAEFTREVLDATKSPGGLDPEGSADGEISDPEDNDMVPSCSTPGLISSGETTSEILKSSVLTGTSITESRSSESEDCVLNDAVLSENSHISTTSASFLPNLSVATLPSILSSLTASSLATLTQTLAAARIPAIAVTLPTSTPTLTTTSGISIISSRQSRMVSPSSAVPPLILSGLLPSTLPVAPIKQEPPDSPTSESPPPQLGSTSFFSGLSHLAGLPPLLKQEPGDAGISATGPLPSFTVVSGLSRLSSVVRPNITTSLANTILAATTSHLAAFGVKQDMSSASTPVLASCSTLPSLAAAGLSTIHPVPLLSTNLKSTLTSRPLLSIVTTVPSQTLDAMESTESSSPSTAGSKASVSASSANASSSCISLEVHRPDERGEEEKKWCCTLCHNGSPCTMHSAQAQSGSNQMLSGPLLSGDPAKPFQCNLCGKHLASKNVYQLHMRSHSGEKPFTCNLCGHHFSQKTSLTRHMRSHTGERPFPCEVCGKRFADKERIKIHMRTHTGEKPFACEVCGKRFSQKSTVKRHMSVHTGEKPFKCETCGKGFANRGNLNAHSKTHANTQ